MDAGKSRKLTGGILLSSILLVYLISLLLLVVISTTKITADFYFKTKEFYQAQIMKELFVADYQQNDYPKTGSAVYNVGQLIYRDEGSQLDITCQVKKRSFKFTVSVAEELQMVNDFTEK